MNAKPDTVKASPVRLWTAVIRLKMKVAAEIRPLLAQYELTGPQWAAIRTLDEAAGDGLRLSELSRRLCVTEGNVTGLVDRLAEGGMVERIPHPDDRRVIIARLTAAGEEVCAHVAPLFEARLEELFASLGPGELEALADSLERLATQVESIGQAEGAAAAAEEK